MKCQWCREDEGRASERVNEPWKEFTSQGEVDKPGRVDQPEESWRVRIEFTSQDWVDEQGESWRTRERVGDEPGESWGVRRELKTNQERVVKARRELMSQETVYKLGRVDDPGESGWARRPLMSEERVDEPGESWQIRKRFEEPFIPPFNPATLVEARAHQCFKQTGVQNVEAGLT